MNLTIWQEYVATLKVKPLFVTVSGAHLYGFPSPDSDVDLRGCHRLPLREIVGLQNPIETSEYTGEHLGIEVDLVSHDVGKYFRLLVRNNGYILEQIFSPLVVCGQELLDELRPIAARCVTKHHFFHYQGFYGTQRKLLEKEEPKRAKSLLYAYRVLMTGIHLMRTGEVEANLLHLNDEFKLPGIDELIASKVTEKAAPSSIDWPFHAARLEALERQLEETYANSTIGETRDYAAVNDLLVRLRLGESAVG